MPNEENVQDGSLACAKNIEMASLPKWHELDDNFQDIALAIRSVNIRLEGFLHLPYLYQQKAIDAGVDRAAYEEMCRRPEVVQDKMPFLQPLHLEIFKEYFHEQQKKSRYLRNARVEGRYQELVNFEATLECFASAEKPGLDDKYAVQILEHGFNHTIYDLVVDDPTLLKTYTNFVSDEDENLILAAFQCKHKERAINKCRIVLHHFENLGLRQKYMDAIIENDLSDFKYARLLKQPLVEIEKHFEFLDISDKQTVINSISKKKGTWTNYGNWLVELDYIRILNIFEFANLRDKYLGKIMNQQLNNSVMERLFTSASEVNIRNAILPIFCRNHELDLCACCDVTQIHFDDFINILSKIFAVKKSGGRNLISYITPSEIQHGHVHGSFGVIDTTTFQIQDIRDTYVVGAIKRFASFLGSSKAKIEAELHTISGLSHRNVLFEWGYILGNETELPMLVINFLNYGTLRDFIQLERSINRMEMLHPDFCRLIFTLAKLSWDICNGLDYLHKHRIVHRDLKLDNILLTYVSNAVIADFGMSRHICEEQGDSIAQNYPATPYYMAPETRRDNLFTFKSDIWSFGVLLRLMWTLSTNDMHDDTADAGIESGSELESKPFEELPHNLKLLVGSIFENNPCLRPTAEKLKSEFNSLLNFPPNEDQLELLLKFSNLKDYQKLLPKISRIVKPHPKICKISKKYRMNVEQERLFCLLAAHQLEFNYYCFLRNILRNVNQ